MSDTSIKPIKIKQIEVVYENGVRLVIDEENPPKIGKMFFSLLQKENIEGRIIEPGEKTTVKKKLSDFWKL
jgi:hypothetical protein